MTIRRGLIYRSPWFYRTAMRILLKNHYRTFYESVACRIPEGASVLDLCSGPGTLYDFLLKKSVKYTALDANESFISHLERRFVPVIQCDLNNHPSLPKADYVVMMGSLYHFLRNSQTILSQMFEAAIQGVLIVESYLSWSSHRLATVRFLAQCISNFGNPGPPLAFDLASLETALKPYRGLLREKFFLPDKRSVLYSFHA